MSQNSLKYKSFILFFKINTILKQPWLCKVLINLLKTQITKNQCLKKVALVCSQIPLSIQQKKSKIVIGAWFYALRSNFDPSSQLVLFEYEFFDF